MTCVSEESQLLEDTNLKTPLGLYCSSSGICQWIAIWIIWNKL